MAKMSDKYTIEVSDEFVKITGTLTIREAFDFMNFFDREGYQILESEEYGTTLCMRKGSVEEERKAQINQETLVHLELIKEELKEEKEKSESKIKELNQKVIDLEGLLRQVVGESKQNKEKLKEAKTNLERFEILKKLKDSPEAAKLCAMEGPGSAMEDLTGFSEGTVE
jgi:hypothetical protein